MTNQGTTTTLKKKVDDNRKGRPNTPDRQQISCYCSDGLLVINFAFSEGECEAYVTDIKSGATHCYAFDSSDQTAEIEIGDIEEFRIEIKTERGATYAEPSPFGE